MLTSDVYNSNQHMKGYHGFMTEFTDDFINSEIDNDNTIKAKMQFMNDNSMINALNNESTATMHFIKLLAKVHSSETEWQSIKELILTEHDRYKLITDNDIKLLDKTFQWNDYMHPTTPTGFMAFANNKSLWRWQSSDYTYRIGWRINDYSMITSAGIASILFFMNKNSSIITDVISTTGMNNAHSVIISMINGVKKQQSDYQDGVNEYKRMSLHDRTMAALQGYTAKVYGNDKKLARNRETTGTIDMNVFSLKKELQDKISRFPRNTRIIPDANDVNKWMHSEFIKLYKNK